jgi:hypothetical protein
MVTNQNEKEVIIMYTTSWRRKRDLHESDVVPFPLSIEKVN